MINSKTGAIYIAEQKLADVLVLNGTTNAIVGKVKTGKIPYALTADSSANKVYVANFYSDDATVITGPAAR